MEINVNIIIVLILLVIALSVIITMSVTNMVEKSLSDIAINVPEAKCPKPTILIQTENGKVKKVELADNNGNKVEGFSTYVGKNDLNDLGDDLGIQSTVIATDSNKPRIFLRQGYHTTPSERNMVNRDDAIRNPRHDDILRYNGPGCFERGGTEKVRRAQLVEDPHAFKFEKCGCSRGAKCYQHVNDPHVDKCCGKPQIAAVNTGRRLTLTAGGEVVDQHVNYYIPQTYLGAAGQRAGMPTGYPSLDNIARKEGEPADVDQIGSIPVNNFEGEPVPIGSIFMP